MTWKRIFRWITGLLCVVMAAFLVNAAAGIWREGMTARASGDALGWIYTREIALQRFASALPMLLGIIALTLIGRCFGAAEKPQGNAQPVKRTEPVPTRRLTIIRAVALAAAVLMIAAGILNGSMRDVLVKAINVCAECVGLG